jgi:hypothetical protein
MTSSPAFTYSVAVSFDRIFSSAQAAWNLTGKGYPSSIFYEIPATIY